VFYLVIFDIKFVFLVSISYNHLYPFLYVMLYHVLFTFVYVSLFC